MDFTFHDLRYTCASWLVQVDVHLLSVRDVLGHRTTAMTEQYAHMDNQKIHDVVAVLDEFRSHSGHTDWESISVTASTHRQVVLVIPTLSSPG